ncbi:MAG: ABC transporter ATP-binding protein [Microvirga sp.]
MTAPVLEVSNLATHFFTKAGVVKAVDGVSFWLAPGEVLGLVGESGSGKSVTGFSLIGLVDPPGRIVSGSVRLEDRELVGLPNDALRRVRGRRIAMVFQDPMMTLNPVLTIADQMRLAIAAHEPVSRSAARARSIAALATVGLPDPARRLDAYPHQFSGGMRQRVVIAISLACNPQILIADEPTTALDVTIQAQILELLRDLQERIGTSVILITHDLGVVAQTAHRVAVMYAGKVVETGTVREIFYNPQMPYTWGLLSSIPLLTADRSQDLIPIPGSPPDMLDPPTGCPFTPRCPYAMQICAEEMPDYTTFSPEHRAACWLHHPMAPDVEPPVKVRGAQ